MKTILEHALELAQRGFHVFPLVPNSKLPLITDYPNRATRDAAQITRWWTSAGGRVRDYNVGISTTAFADAGSLVVVDIDTKSNGYDSALLLELEGKELPCTLRTVTPSGGAHLFYRTSKPVKQGAGVLGKGLDIRSRGGYVVGPGSLLDGRAYAFTDSSLPTVECPEWIVRECGLAKPKPPKEEISVEISQERAERRAKFYLEHEAPTGELGTRNDTCYQVANRLKDFGVDTAMAAGLIAVYWKCEPPPDMEKVAEICENAFRYGNKSPGADAPEAHFDEIAPASYEGELDEDVSTEPLHPFQELNQEFAFVLAGGGHHILWETKDVDGQYNLVHLGELSFHKKFAAKVMTIGDGKTKPVTEMWMKHKDRRSYDGLCFKPGLNVGAKWYNLWRGFAVEPVKGTPKHDALDAFLEHALKNICNSDEKLFRWLIGYFAQLVQKPSTKPLTTLVFRGTKGVGKNAIVDIVGSLLGRHYFATAKKRYLTGNFNSHLEHCLMLTLNEAFWSGDKEADGILKDLTTGENHVIEHKGKEPYTIKNITRVVVMGNEDWLVPASEDERRYAVFNVGEGRKQDIEFFKAMHEGMAAGGKSHLLKYLLDYDLSNIEVNRAPNTAGLLEQKLSSLDPLGEWWFSCLTEGIIVESDFAKGWPEDMSKARFRDAFYRHAKERNIRGRMPDERWIGRFLAKCAPSIDRGVKQREGDIFVKLYRFPELAIARQEWQKFIGHEIVWELDPKAETTPPPPQKGCKA